jgi:hypothetical protein
MKKQKNKLILIYTKLAIFYKLNNMIFSLNIKDGDDDKDNNFS